MNDLEKMCRDHFNEPMIVSFDLVRCVGYAEDEMDCYIIIRYRNWMLADDNEVDDRWHTCVGGYTFLDRLKGQGYVRGNNGEDWDDFTRLDKILTLNNAPRATDFILKSIR